jgi:hypothetical protein
MLLSGIPQQLRDEMLLPPAKLKPSNQQLGSAIICFPCILVVLKNTMLGAEPRATAAQGSSSMLLLPLCTAAGRTIA